MKPNRRRIIKKKKKIILKQFDAAMIVSECNGDEKKKTQPATKKSK